MGRSSDAQRPKPPKSIKLSHIKWWKEKKTFAYSLDTFVAWQWFYKWRDRDPRKRLARDHASGWWRRRTRTWACTGELVPSLLHLSPLLAFSRKEKRLQWTRYSLFRARSSWPGKPHHILTHPLRWLLFSHKGCRGVPLCRRNLRDMQLERCRAGIQHKQAHSSPQPPSLQNYCVQWNEHNALLNKLTSSLSKHHLRPQRSRFSGGKKKKSNNYILKYVCVSVSGFALKMAKWNTTPKKCCVKTRVILGKRIEVRIAVHWERLCHSACLCLRQDALSIWMCGFGNSGVILEYSLSSRQPVDDLLCCLSSSVNSTHILKFLIFNWITAVLLWTLMTIPFCGHWEGIIRDHSRDDAGTDASKNSTLQGLSSGLAKGTGCYQICSSKSCLEEPGQNQDKDRQGQT